MVLFLPSDMDEADEATSFWKAKSSLIPYSYYVNHIGSLCGSANGVEEVNHHFLMPIDF